jgi:hypothetical protein
MHSLDFSSSTHLQRINLPAQAPQLQFTSTCIITSSSTNGLSMLAKAFTLDYPDHGVHAQLHMPHDTHEALTDLLLGHALAALPVPGFVAMFATHGTLVADFVSQHARI